MSMGQDQMAEVKECFTMYDRDNDGQIPCRELGTVVRSLGCHPTEADLSDIINNSIRKNSFGLNDLVQVVAKYRSMSKDKDEEIREAFRVFDRDGSGFVSAAELKHVMTNIGEKLTEEEVDEMMREVDVGDGQINYEEFVQVIVGF